MKALLFTAHSVAASMRVRTIAWVAPKDGSGTISPGMAAVAEYPTSCWARQIGWSRHGAAMAVVLSSLSIVVAALSDEVAGMGHGCSGHQ